MLIIQEETWGIAYKVLPSDVPEVMAYLDHRERGGYTTHKLTFHPEPEKSKTTKVKKTTSSEGQQPRITMTVLAYVATEVNPNYLGPAPIEDVAKQVVGSRGPSGCNAEYILNLAHAMREIAPNVDDRHLFSLEGKVREQLEIRLKVTVTGTKKEFEGASKSIKQDLPAIDDDCTCNYCIIGTVTSKAGNNL